MPSLRPFASYRWYASLAISSWVGLSRLPVSFAIQLPPLTAPTMKSLRDGGVVTLELPMSEQQADAVLRKLGLTNQAGHSPRAQRDSFGMSVKLGRARADGLRSGTLQSER
jgi:hypothetical protein